MDARRASAPAFADYRSLRVWQVATDLVIESYRLGELLPARERFGLVAQIRRAATSVPANIAEATVVCTGGSTCTICRSLGAH